MNAGVRPGIFMCAHLKVLFATISTQIEATKRCVLAHFARIATGSVVEGVAMCFQSSDPRVIGPCPQTKSGSGRGFGIGWARFDGDRAGDFGPDGRSRRTRQALGDEPARLKDLTTS